MPKPDWVTEQIEELRPEDIGLANAIDHIPTEIPTKEKLFYGLKKANFPVPEEELPALEAFHDAVVAGLVKMKKRVDGEYQEVVASLDDVLHACRLNRKYLPLNRVTDVLMKRRCPLDLHLYADDYGVEDANK